MPGFDPFKLLGTALPSWCTDPTSRKEVTKQEVAELFSGKFKMWADLGGPDTKSSSLTDPNENNRDAFEQQLHIVGKIPDGTKIIAKDEKVIKTIAGTYRLTRRLPMFRLVRPWRPLPQGCLLSPTGG